MLALGPAPAALAAPTQVTLHLAGTHPEGLDRHEGTFTASPPLCPSGSWVGNGVGGRVFTCSDGSGTFTASFQGELEHTQGSTGPWAIVDGTGAYAALRGEGEATIDFSTGENSPLITFRDTWTGVVDFDVTAPIGSFTAVKVVHPRTSRGRWRVTVSFSARDNVEGNRVTFSATAVAGPFTAFKSGAITDGSGSFTVAFRRAKRARSMRVAIVLLDPWGNTSKMHKTIRLR
jgi:hypothetical protein